MPDTGGKPVVETIREMEEDNYQATRALLGETATVAEHLSALYDFLPQAYTAAKLPAKDEYISPLLFLLGCQYQLVIATLAAERGHLSDALQATRRAIESCAFARRISRHPHLAVTWLEAADSDEAYERYRDKFTKLFPGDDPLMVKMGERYDQASKQMHSTVYSFAARVKQSETPAAISIDFGYFEIDANDRSEPARALLWIWDTHFGIIQVFAEILAKALAPVKASWNLKYNTVDAALHYHKEKWRPLVYPTSGGNGG